MYAHSQEWTYFLLQAISDYPIYLLDICCQLLLEPKCWIFSLYHWCSVRPSHSTHFLTLQYRWLLLLVNFFKKKQQVSATARSSADASSVVAWMMPCFICQYFYVPGLSTPCISMCRVCQHIFVKKKWRNLQVTAQHLRNVKKLVEWGSIENMRRL